MSGESYRGQEQDERLANPDAYFSGVYGHISVVYGDYPEMPLGDLLAAERTFRGDADVDSDDQRLRAAQHVRLVAAAGDNFLLEEDMELVSDLSKELAQLKIRFGEEPKQLELIRSRLSQQR